MEYDDNGTPIINQCWQRVTDPKEFNDKNVYGDEKHGYFKFDKVEPVMIDP